MSSCQFDDKCLDALEQLESLRASLQYGENVNWDRCPVCDGDYVIYDEAEDANSKK